MFAILLSMVSAFAQADYDISDVTVVVPDPEGRTCVNIGWLVASSRRDLRGYTSSCNLHGVQPYLLPAVRKDGEYVRRIKVCYPWDLEPIPAQTTCEIYDPDGNFFAYWTVDFIYEF